MLRVGLTQSLHVRSNSRSFLSYLLNCLLLSYIACICLLVILSRSVSAQQAEGMVRPDFRKGVLCGRVADVVTGKPLAGATVALVDVKGRVMAWTQTDSDGEYAIAIDALKTLRLRPSPRRTLLESVCRDMGIVAGVPVRIAGATAKAVKGAASMKTAENLALAAVTGNPAPLATQVLTSTLGTVKGTPGSAETGAKITAVKVAFNDMPATPGAKPVVVGPGEVILAISAAGYKEARTKSQVYWLDAPATINDCPVGTQAWVKTVAMAPLVGDKKLEVKSEELSLTDPLLQTQLVPAGERVRVSVKLHDLTGLASRVRVFAREARRHSVVELRPGKDKDKDIFSGDLLIDPHTPAGETVVSIAALRTVPIEVKLPPDHSEIDPLYEFVRRLDDLDPGKPYDYDPRIMASINRLDIRMTVLDPQQATPINSLKPPK